MKARPDLQSGRYYLLLMNARPDLQSGRYLLFTFMGFYPDWQNYPYRPPLADTFPKGKILHLLPKERV